MTNTIDLDLVYQTLASRWGAENVLLNEEEGSIYYCFEKENESFHIIYGQSGLVRGYLELPLRCPWDQAQPDLYQLANEINLVIVRDLKLTTFVHVMDRKLYLSDACSLRGNEDVSAKCEEQVERMHELAIPLAGWLSKVFLESGKDPMPDMKDGSQAIFVYC